jgi:hypothetical protein
MILVACCINGTSFGAASRPVEQRARCPLWVADIGGFIFADPGTEAVRARCWCRREGDLAAKQFIAKNC